MSGAAIAKLAEAKAEVMWQRELSNSEKAGICHGLFPADKLEKAKAEGYDQQAVQFALMDLAAKTKERKTA